MITYSRLSPKCVMKIQEDLKRRIRKIEARKAPMYIALSELRKNVTGSLTVSNAQSFVYKKLIHANLLCFHSKLQN